MKQKSPKSFPKLPHCCIGAIPFPSWSGKNPLKRWVYLLWHGELANGKEQSEFEKQERKKRPHLDKNALTFLQSMEDSHPMDTLRTLISYWGAAGHPWDDSGGKEVGEGPEISGRRARVHSGPFSPSKAPQTHSPQPKTVFFRKFSHHVF